MSGLTTGIGLISGLDISQIVDALIASQRQSVRRLEQRMETLEARDGGLQVLSANLMGITSAVQQLGNKSTFEAFSVANSDESQLSVTARPEASTGAYRFQSVQTAANHQALSRGMANADQQTFGSGTLTIATGGGLHQPTTLDSLNGGEGVRRGIVQITDRAGNSAAVDLSNAYYVDDVVRAINNQDGISVVAGTRDGRLVLTDTSGETTSDLRVDDLSGGHAAQDLGIRNSVAADTLEGETVYQITGDFPLDQLNDGNAPRLLANSPDIRITLTDDTVLDVNLDDVVTLNDVIGRINDHEDNDGKLAASLVEGRVQLEDLSGGGGAGAFTIEDVNGASVVRQLGLDVDSDGDTITGRRLAAGINSVLLRNLRGGQGIDEIGEITLTDRAGVTTTIDLTGAESLDEVLHAINTATAQGPPGQGPQKLQLAARINAAGTGIEVRDTSGSTDSNLTIADVGGSTLAAQLGIAVDAPQDAVDSGSLSLRYVNEATSLEDYAPDGGSVSPGSFRIVDSAGNAAVVNISSAVNNIGDVLQRINAASGIAVTAALNETGDGMVLIDEAGGEEALRVEQVEGTTAADLRLLGTGEPGDDEKSRIQSRRAMVVEVDDDDTLTDIAEKINALQGSATASIFDDGSGFNSTRLSLTSKDSGAAGRLFLDETGLDLGLRTQVEGRDALLRIGENAANGFLIASESNTFENAAAGVDVDVLNPSHQPANINIDHDTSQVEQAVQSFVTAYNTFATAAADLTRFNPDTNERGVLQGEGLVLRIQSRLDSLVTRPFAADDQPIRSLADLGIRTGTGGRLVLDQERLADVLRQNPQAAADFFLEEETGFADLADTTLQSFTDPFTGTITLKEDALRSSAESLTRRIQQLDGILEVRRERLLRQFVQMEEALSALTSHQQAIAEITPLSINSRNQNR